MRSNVFPYLALALMAPVDPSQQSEESGSGGGTREPGSPPVVTPPQASLAKRAHTTAPVHAGLRRPPMNSGSIALVLAQVKMDCSSGTYALTEFFNVVQVPQTKNFSIQPILQAGERTPWASIRDDEKVYAFLQAAEALDAAGYGFPEEKILVEGKEVVLPAESVFSTFRFTRRANPASRPQMFVNFERFDRVTAQTLARTRQALQQATPEQRAVMERNIADLVQAATNKNEAEGAQAIVDESAKL